jgi:D-amino-acid oxidase
MLISRRVFLGAAPLMAAGCTATKPTAARVPPPVVPTSARLAPVNVAADRVIRTVVGLRPFRPSGFVVRAEKLDAKTVIHNYGHGGSGITLSWGTAQLAVEEAAGVEARDCAVIGCGVIGLSTARLLQLRGYTPTIYARDMPPLTTSNIAGGLWEPVSLYDQDRVTPQFRRQFTTAAGFAFRRFQSLAGDQYAVRWMPLLRLSRDRAFQPPNPQDPGSEIEPLYPESRQLDRSEHPFDLPFVHRQYSMLIEPATYLAMLIRDFELAGGRIVIRAFDTQRDLMALRENLIFNCTGLGARTLFQDQELTPIRGQLVVLMPQPEVNYMTLGPDNVYMFPRHDGILLGGSFQRGESNLEPDPAISERILRENQAVFRGMRT